MSYLKQYGTSAKGNDRLLKKYGGNDGNSPMARQKYATGGAVKAGNPSLNEGLGAAAEGAPAKPSLARPGRKMPGKGKDKKGGKTNVNVIIAQAPPKGDAMPMPPGGPQMAGPPGPPMPPPGGPPMPMRASGGRIANLGKYAHGGRIKKTTKGDKAQQIADAEESGGKYAKGGRVKRATGGRVGRADGGSSWGYHPGAFDVINAATQQAAANAGTQAQALQQNGGYHPAAFDVINPATQAIADQARAAAQAQAAQPSSGYHPAAFDVVNAATQAAVGQAPPQAAARGQGWQPSAPMMSEGAYDKGAPPAGAPPMPQGGPMNLPLPPGIAPPPTRATGGRVNRREGGPAYGLDVKTGGGGGAKGRLAKIRMYGK